MRIAAWNMHYQGRSAPQRKDAWRYLRDVVRADVALVQEAVAPPEVAVLPIREVVLGRRWGTTVASFGPVLRAVAAHDDLPAGAVALAEVPSDRPDGPLFVSMYGLDGDAGYPASISSFVERLAPILQTASERPIFLAGDFNVSTQLDGVRKRANHDVLKRIESLGFVNLLTRTRLQRAAVGACRCKDPDCDHVQTHRWLRKAHASFQLDYFFASMTALPQIRSCELFDGEEAWALSDHCPFAVEWG